MSIIKNRLSRNFTTLPNAIITENISANAFRVYCYLISKPDGWTVLNSDIKDKLNIKHDRSIAKYFKELIATGWITRKKSTDENGRFAGGYDYQLNEIAFLLDDDLIGKKCSCVKNAHVSKMPKQVLSTNSCTNTESNNNITPTPLGDVENGQGRYPERETNDDIKNSAYRCWLKIIKDNEMAFTNDELLAIQLYSEAKPFLQPHDILANLLTLSVWANDGLDIRIALLNSFKTKSIIPAKLPVMHDKQGNRLMHQAIAKKRLRQIEQEQQENNCFVGNS